MAAGVDEQIAWERKRSRPAAAAALLSSFATLAAAIVVGAVFADVPSVGVLDALGRSVQPGPIGGTPSLRTPIYEFYSDHNAGILLAAVLRSVGLIALGWAVTYLAGAVRFRRPEFPRAAQPLALVGGVISAVGTLMASIGTSTEVSTFLDGPRTVATADEVGTGALLGAGQLLDRLVGPLALALALVLVSLNAMRLGLITRFVGVLGMISGALLIFPIGSPLPIVQCVWLILLAITFLGYWPGGTPPSWRTGRPEPWPTAVEQREARMRARAGAQAGDGEAQDAEDRTPATVGASRQRSSQKRKRKRRT